MKKRIKIIEPIWAIMKVSTIQFLLMAITGALGYANNSSAQELLMKKVSIHAEQLEIKQVLSKIEKEANVRFVYSVQLLPVDRKITVDIHNETIAEALESVFGPDRISYEIVRNKIVLKLAPKKSALLPLNSISTPISYNKVADRVITGIVRDNGKEPLPGVNIAIKGSNLGTNTDVNGKYTIEVPTEDAILVYSFVGYLPQEVRVGVKSSIDVNLVPDIKALEEVVVIGYGTTKRQDFTGAVSSMKLEGSAMAQMPNLNALEALKGNLPGLNIGATNTAGGQPSVLVRGQNSINGSNDPLIVLDGVIFLGSLSDINPSDIANIDVLKDATSAAAYGSRSANGVIAITTKRGKIGKPVITFNTSTGFQTWQNRPVMMKGEEWISVVNARNKYTEGSTNWLKAGELANREAGNETNWLDETTRTGVIQSYQAAVSGAQENVNYYLSTSYDDNQAIVKGDQFNRISILGKLKTNITDWLEIGVDGSYSKRDYSGVTANIGQAQTMSPYGVMYRDDLGNLEKYPYTQSGINPLWGVDDGTRDNINILNSYRLNTNALISIPWIQGLTYRVNLLNNVTKNETGNFTYEDYYVQEGEGIQRYDPSVIQGFLTNANGNLNRNGINSYVFDNIVNYKNDFGNHGIDLTLVATRDNQKYNYMNTTGSDFSANGNTTLGMYGLHKATVQRVDLDAYERSNIGYLARLSYSFSDKYFFTGSFRRDGASVFGQNNKWANFYAAGVAWKITNENFLKQFEVLNSMKLKFSMGQNGNQGISPYGTLSTVSNAASGGVRYEFSDKPGTVNYGLYQSALGNADLGWETTTSWNGGFESSWLQNRLSVNLDLYFGKTVDQIFTRNIPVMTGFKTIKTSMGQVNNSGVELSISSDNIRGKKLNWNTSLTFWKNNNKLVKLYGEDNDGDGREDDDISSSLFIGEPLNVIYGYEQIGIVQEDDTEYMALTGAAAGSPMYKDLDGVEGISANDRKIIGYRNENFRLNLRNNFSYKNFDLYVLVSGIFGGNNRYMQENTEAYLTAGTGRFNDNMTSKAYWTPENRSNEYPSAYFAGDGRFTGLQSRTFVRIQDITLSYKLESSWLSAVRMKSAKLFVSGRNLGTFTNWFGGDPETGTPVRSNTFPVASTYSFGANFSF
ncbi:TonB-linked SusC/RagA family outer membrane protein [Dyadobacter jejuensis]|uniref:TonB-linked SusC/RagA family outer membrane protein n=1 Tax=Dyadobacter jejuensis TaxID=1082580 RepID=A0A316ACN7_9BACT|nr:TonB-dependent receptor [Dyadobacter jejuensis]PWJ55018.1 TonB-linked SusC/RagA family outer membrane protein [Dyadobacter jejuensis]